MSAASLEVSDRLREAGFTLTPDYHHEGVRVIPGHALGSVTVAIAHKRDKDRDAATAAVHEVLAGMPTYTMHRIGHVFSLEYVA